MITIPKYSEVAQTSVEKAIHKLNEGTLKVADPAKKSKAVSRPLPSVFQKPERKVPEFPG